MRYSTNDISSDADFDNATAVTGIGAPRMAGEDEEYTITNLKTGKTYYFAIKAKDDEGNTSEVVVGVGPRQVYDIWPNSVQMTL